MIEKEIEQQVASVLQKWDPFQQAKNPYQKERQAVLTVLLEVNDPSELGKEIRNIYKETFDHWLPIEACVEIAYQLLAIKYKALAIV